MLLLLCVLLMFASIMVFCFAVGCHARHCGCVVIRGDAVAVASKVAVVGSVGVV